MPPSEDHEAGEQEQPQDDIDQSEHEQFECFELLGSRQVSVTGFSDRLRNLEIPESFPSKKSPPRPWPRLFAFPA
jgi:hypothetical protein